MEEISVGIQNWHVLFSLFIVADWLPLNKWLYSVSGRRPGPELEEPGLVGCHQLFFSAGNHVLLKGGKHNMEASHSSLSESV